MPTYIKGVSMISTRAEKIRFMMQGGYSREEAEKELNRKLKRKRP